MRTARRNIKGRNEKETVRVRGGDGHGCGADRSGSGSGGFERQRRLDRLRGSLEHGGWNIFAGLHRREADEVAAAGKNRLPTESQHVLAFFDEQRLLRPLDLVAFAERAEGGDVFRQGVHGGAAVGALAVKGVENGIVVDALEEFVDRGKAAAQEGEVERTERSVEERGLDRRRISFRQRIGVLILIARVREPSVVG